MTGGNDGCCIDDEPEEVAVVQRILLGGWRYLIFFVCLLATSFIIYDIDLHGECF